MGKTYFIRKYKELNNSKCTYLLTASLFYLQKSYKSSLRYSNGLLKVVDFIITHENYCLRVYYDRSIFLNPNYMNLFKYLKLQERIELYEYFCPKMIYEKTYHMGTFGSLMRFLPLFEKSQYKIIYLLDIDDDSYNYIDLYFNHLMENKSKQIYFYNIEGYGQKYLNKFNNKYNDIVIANIFVKEQRFNIKLFDNYIDLLIGTTDLFDMFEEINESYSIVKKASKPIRRTYGLDEYFLNKYLIDVMEDKQIGWIKEELYYDFFLKNLINYDNYQDVIFKYFIQVLELLDKNFYILCPNATYEELKKILECVLNVGLKYNDENYSNIIEHLRTKFLVGYIDFGNKFKKLTQEYYMENFYIFNEVYMDDLDKNNFNSISWYIRKNWNNFPLDIIKNFELIVTDK